MLLVAADQSQALQQPLYFISNLRRPRIPYRGEGTTEVDTVSGSKFFFSFCSSTGLVGTSQLLLDGDLSSKIGKKSLFKVLIKD